MPPFLIVEGDCLRHLRMLPDRSVDAVITDPPWNLGKRYGTHDDAMPAERYADWLGSVLAHCARVARGPVIVLPGACNAGHEHSVLRRAGLTGARRLVWRKPSPEPILWTKSAPPADLPGTIWAPESRAHDPLLARHPCPKPVELLRRLVAAATRPGDTVLDPFAGTGSTLVAAAESGRAAIGIELEARYCAVARRRTARARLDTG